jgi:ABC-2 type transport system ATP-binding protein
MIEIKNVTKSFGKKVILNDLNLKIGKGTIYALLGKNGVGKTTLINTIVDLVPLDNGSILINDKAHDSLDQKDKAKLGFLGEDLALIEELNGQEFLKFIGKIYNLPKKTIDKRIKDLFNYFFENEADLQKSIFTYSTGMKKKVAFCAAVIHSPDTLLLDEPFSGLDPFVANQMIEFLKVYNEKNKTILISSHDLSYLEKVASHIGVLNGGQLVFNSTLQDFTDFGMNSIDKSLLNIIKPSESKLSQIDWL